MAATYCSRLLMLLYGLDGFEDRESRLDASRNGEVAVCQEHDSDLPLWHKSGVRPEAARGSRLIEKDLIPGFFPRI
nr:hypothetical protein [Rhizobium laguerreae]